MWWLPANITSLEGCRGEEGRESAEFGGSEVVAWVLWWGIANSQRCLKSKGFKPNIKMGHTIQIHYYKAFSE